MIKTFLKMNGFHLKDIVVWNGIIACLDSINDFIKEPEDVRMATKKEIERYLKHQ